jgi:hypothetical protein
MILTHGRLPGVSNAVGARNGSQRVQPSPDPARRSQILLAGQRLPVRLSPTVTDAPEFPDTEEVTSSNLVRPTQFFENLSGANSADGSQPPAVLALRCWSEHRRFGSTPTAGSLIDALWLPSSSHEVAPETPKRFIARQGDYAVLAGS